MDLSTAQGIVDRLTAGLEASDPAALRAVVTAVRDDLALALSGAAATPACQPEGTAAGAAAAASVLAGGAPSAAAEAAGNSAAPLPDAAAEYHIYVHSPTNRTITLSVTSAVTTCALRRLIQDKEGLPPENGKLMLGVKELGCRRTLMDCGVTEGATIHISLSGIRGGLFKGCTCINYP